VVSILSCIHGLAIALVLCCWPGGLHFASSYTRHIIISHSICSAVPSNCRYQLFPALETTTYKTCRRRTFAQSSPSLLDMQTMHHKDVTVMNSSFYFAYGDDTK
jgi:hypothetical protein